MVRERINITEHTNDVLNVFKAMHHLKNKSEAVEHMLKEYDEKVLQPKLRSKQQTIRTAN